MSLDIEAAAKCQLAGEVAGARATDGDAGRHDRPAIRRGGRRRAANRYRIEALAYDRWRIETFRQALAEEGVTDVPLIPHGQGYRDMGPAVDALERAVAERRLRHGNHPLLTWCVGNAVVTRDPAGNAKLDKSRSNRRIDGAVSLAMALNAMQTRPAEPASEPLVMVV